MADYWGLLFLASFLVRHCAKDLVVMDSAPRINFAEQGCCCPALLAASRHLRG